MALRIPVVLPFACQQAIHERQAEPPATRGLHCAPAARLYRTKNPLPLHPKRLARESRIQQQWCNRAASPSVPGSLPQNRNVSRAVDADIRQF